MSLGEGGRRSESWMVPIKAYLEDGALLADPKEAQQIKRNSSSYTLLDGHLFRFRYSRLILTFIGRVMIKSLNFHKDAFKTLIRALVQSK